MAGFIDVIRLIQDGELVKAAIANRAAQQNDINIRYLRELFEAAMLGETVFARARTVEVDAKVGMAVYYNSQTREFERGMGQVDVNEQGYFETAASTQIWGIIYRKLTDNKADILLHGVADVDMSQAIEGTPEQGKVYYLSNVAPGMLESQRPPVGAAVLTIGEENGDGTHEVYVNTKFHDLLEAHRHYKFTLVPEPAGDHTPPTPGERHVITNPDADLEGWLPANHASFNGKAPPGAAFGYNIAASKLHHVWPPLPIEGAYLEWSKAEDKELLSMGVPLGPEQLCVIDRNGIWWMSDCYDDVPWATTFTGTESVSDSESFIECPRLLFPQLLLWFTKPVFQTTGTAVLSLTATDNSGLVITCIDTGEPASTGHLLIDLDLALIIASNTHPGHLAFKDLDSNGRILRGPVVESLKAGSANVSLASNVAAVDGKYYGNVVITVDLELDGKEIAVDTVRLDGCEEEFYEDTIALGFRNGIRANFRGRINIPAGLPIPAGTKVKLRFWFLNRSTSNMPAELFSLTYRKVTMPSTVETPQSLPTSGAEVALANLPATAVDVGGNPDQYFTIESESFDISAGDTILFTLERAGDTDGFGGNIHLLRQRGVYVEPTS